MSDWLPTCCALCAQNCGLLVQVEENRIVRVKGDPDNPRSRGYVCRKGMNIAHFQHHAERLSRPLKKTADGFVEISWDQAIDEIGARLRAIVDEHGPRSFAFMGGGGQASHFEAGFGTALLRGLGSQYHYSPLAQELTGYFWCAGRLFGRQNRFPIPDEEHAEMLVGVGWNGMVSHQMPRAPLLIREFARNPEKMLVVIDPRKSETAREANLHLALRPGTDALLARAMIALILREGWEQRDYLEQHCKGFEQIRPWFEGFDIEAALEVCEVAYEQVFELCRLLTTRKWCMHHDLGVYMNRHSTLATYLYLLLLAVCGRLCVPGGNVIPGSMIPLGGHSDERSDKTWRTVETGFPAIMGYFPPNVMPEEILSERDDRLRAVICSSSNPLRSYADTGAWERAVDRLDLLVTIDIAMSETAAVSDYVLPAYSPYESYDGSFFTWTYPEIYFHMRHPVVKPKGERRESGSILASIAKAAGVLPELPGYLYRAARKGRMEFTMALLSWLQANRKYARLLPLVIAEARKDVTPSGNFDMLWGMLLASPKSFRAASGRVGLKMPGPLQALARPKRLFKALRGLLSYRSPAALAILSPAVAHAEQVYRKILASPSGLWIGKAGEDNFRQLKTGDGKIYLHVPEMEEWLAELEPAAEAAALEPDPDFPLVLNAGRHKPENANTLMRNPEWNKGRRACTLAMNPADAAALGLTDGETVRVVTVAASEQLELEVTEDVRRGQVLIPHGFGLRYRGEEYGINVNRLTSAGHRDRIAATPLHRHVPCRVEKIGL